MKVFFIIALVSSPLELISATDSEECRSACPKIAAPVCAVECTNYKYETFSNDCIRNERNDCTGSNYQPVHNGTCNGSSNSTCTDNPDSPICVYDPVTDTKQTYNNNCDMMAASVCKKIAYKKASEGACCPKLCTAEYAPVCGFDKTDKTFKDFSNECEFEAANDCPPIEFSQNRFGFFDYGDCSCYAAYTNEYDQYGPFCAYSHTTITFRTFYSKKIMEAVNNCTTSRAHDFKMFLRKPCY